MVPHREFWTSLPGLIKEGFLFTVTKLRCRGEGGVYTPLVT